MDRLISHLKEHVLPLEPERQSDAFGGWSVWSSNGSYRDGWQQGHRILAQNHLTEEERRRELTKLGLASPLDFRKPTEICHGYLAEVLKTIDLAGLYPRRARIIQLSPHSSSSWHRDAPDHIYMVRLHIPILTNPGCFFETETERAHLPADGRAYFLFVNGMHRVVNDGDTPRYHLVVDVNDTKKVTQHHQYHKRL